MTLLCKCINNCCSWCCHCCKSFCNYCYNIWCSVVCVGCGCCLFGMAFMLLIIYLYYSVYVYPGAAVVEPGEVYQYEHEYPIYKRESRSESEDSYVEDYDYDDSRSHDNADGDEILRHKRGTGTSTVTTPSSSKTSQPNSTKIITSPQSEKSSNNNGTNYNATKSETLDSSHDTMEEELDFKLSNIFVNSVHEEAERAKIKDPLGLCRNNEDIKIPDMNVNLFPLEHAQEIIKCINDLLKSQSKKHLCVELNEEMSAYLKWLLLTGESKERRKQWKITGHQDDFLFPSTCGDIKQYQEILTEAPIVPESSRTIELGPGEEVLTTCAPVKPGKPGKPDKPGKSAKSGKTK